MAQTVKNLPAVLETQIQSLGRENPLEEEMVTHSRGAWRATVQGATKELDMTKHAHTHTHTQVCSLANPAKRSTPREFSHGPHDAPCAQLLL